MRLLLVLPLCHTKIPSNFPALQLHQADTSEIAYTAVLIDARRGWRLDSSGGRQPADAPESDTTSLSTIGSSLLSTPDLGRALVDKMGGQVAAELQNTTPKQLAVLRLQVALAAAQEAQTAGEDAEHAAREARLAALARRAASVCSAAAAGEGAAPAGARDYERAFDAVLAYVLEASGLSGETATAAGMMGSSAAATATKAGAAAPRSNSGSSSGCSVDPAVRAEAAAALDSVFPLPSVARWVTLAPAERLAELRPVAQLTLGICLFNSQAAGDSGVGGAGGGPLALGVVAQQVQQGRQLLQAVEAAEAAAWAAFRSVNLKAAAAVPGEEGPSAAALFCAQAATALRLMAADAQQGLAACEEIDGALHDEIETVRFILRCTWCFVLSLLCWTHRVLRRTSGHTIAYHPCRPTNHTQLRRLVGSSAAVSKDAVFPQFERAGALRLALAQVGVKV
jgi:hypothetical protein